MYNGIGNVLSVKTYSYTSPDTEPSGDSTTSSLNYSDTSTPDRLTKYRYSNIGYNAIGYPVTYGSKHLDWSNGKLTKFYEEEDPAGFSSSESIEFSYNAFGQRVRKEYSYYPGVDYSGDFSIGKEVNYDYDHSGRLIREISTEYFTESASQTRELIFLYDGSSMVGFTYSINGASQTTYYYLRNLQGDVIAIYDTNGAKVVSYSYDAYGNCTIDSTTTDYDLAHANPIRYRGYYYDNETGFYYLNSRYYNPEWRRFISPANASALNPHAVNGLNLYCYCNNNPINVQYNTVTSNSTDIGGVTVSSMSLVADIGTTFSNGFRLGFSFPSLSLNSLLKNTLLSLSEVSGTLFYSLTNNGQVMINYHRIFDGVDGFTVLDNLPHPVNNLFKGMGITLSVLDTFSAGFDSYNSGHSLGQGVLNVALTGGKNYMVYKTGAYVTAAVGKWAGAKLGASIGAWAGPAGMVAGITIGTLVGYLIDEFGDSVIDWIVGWFD